MMSSGNGESRGLFAVRVIVLVPLLWFLLAGLIGKFAGRDWVPIEAWAWPMMIAPFALTVVFVMFRRIIQDPEHVGSLPTMSKVAAGLLLVANGALIIYSWVAVVPAVLCLAILLSGLIKKPAKETP
ncbi:hypothetical protein [Streptomyces ochraceiscleroticus]|uniref:DUF2568 domain-containing protein n=1 Tax=Streptomyces ochraceiscleroticus TaxID=47761 RepID=A0ABW1MEI5_9ACTN|nr:hypothetical protein [Streptomyces ochraceiscleroticus]